MMSWLNTLRTSAEDLGTLAEYDLLTGYEPNDYFVTEAFVEYTQESLSEQRFPNDFDYDVSIGKALSDACRRRADHSQEEGLSSCLSSSVSHDRTVRPVVKPFESQISSVQGILRHSFSKLGFFWNDKESRFSLTAKQRFENTNSRQIVTEEVFKS